jgi:CDP-diacylglycerol--glycerol-3-phosphate 3-phosphatidyltransferase
MSASNGKFLFVQALTLVRIPLILIFLLVSLCVNTRNHPLWFNVAFYSMIASAVTDLFDGFFARRFNVVSRLGAYADPLCDKFFYLTAFPTLVFLSALQSPQLGVMDGHTRLLLALAIFYLMRDQWVTFLRSIGSLYNVDARAHFAGKFRTFISFPIICMIYYYLQAPRHWRLQLPSWLIYILEATLLVVNLHSIWYYTKFYWPWIQKELRPDADKN